MGAEQRTVQAFTLLKKTKNQTCPPPLLYKMVWTSSASYFQLYWTCMVQVCLSHSFVTHASVNTNCQSCTTASAECQVCCKVQPTAFHIVHTIVMFPVVTCWFSRGWSLSVAFKVSTGWWFVLFFSFLLFLTIILRHNPFSSALLLLLFLFTAAWRLQNILLTSRPPSLQRDKRSTLWKLIFCSV